MKRPRRVVTLVQIAARLRAAGFQYVLFPLSSYLWVSLDGIGCGSLYPVQDEDYATATRDITRDCLPIVKAIQKAP